VFPPEFIFFRESSHVAEHVANMSSSTQPFDTPNSITTSNIHDIAAFSVVAELASRTSSAAFPTRVKPDPDAPQTSKPSRANNTVYVPVKCEDGLDRTQTLKSSSSSNNSSATSSTSTKVQRFVQKLWNIVNAGSALVGWNASGTRIVVHKPKQFAEQILPRYFNTCNLSSFTRQLHFYGFKKTLGRKRSRQENWECEHEWFARNHPEWLTRITRKRCNVQLASQEETSELRKQLRTLQDTVARQQKQLESLASMMLALSREKKNKSTTKERLPDDSTGPTADSFETESPSCDAGYAMEDFVSGGFGLPIEDFNKNNNSPATGTNYWS